LDTPIPVERIAEATALALIAQHNGEPSFDPVAATAYQGLGSSSTAARRVGRQNPRAQV
jgi:hypothetical protein